MNLKGPVIADSKSQVHSHKPITNKRSKLKGGDPSDIPIRGNDSIQEAFSSSQGCSCTIWAFTDPLHGQVFRN